MQTVMFFISLFLGNVTLFLLFDIIYVLNVIKNDKIKFNKPCIGDSINKRKLFNTLKRYKAISIPNKKIFSY